MLKQKKYIRGHYRTIYTDRPIWKWREHLKLSMIPVLLFLLFWQLNVAFKAHFVTSPKIAYAESILLISPLPTGTPKPTQTPLPSHVSWGEFKQRCRQLAKIYNFPVNVMLAQAALESKDGTSGFATQRNNYFGLHAYTDSPDDAWYFDNPEQSIISYMMLIHFDARYASAWATKNNPIQMIQNIKDAGYATDPDYVAKVESMPEWSEQ